MRKATVVLLVLLGAGIAPVMGGEKSFGLGAGYVLGSYESDSVPVEFDSDGYSIHGSVGLTARWSLLIVFRDMKDDEFLLFNEKDTYTIFGVDAAYTWRVDTKLRPYAKFGLAHADFEAALPSLPTLSDDGIGLSVGGGLEVGSHRFAFFLDLDFVEVELRLGQIEDDLSFADATLGFIYRF